MVYFHDGEIHVKQVGLKEHNFNILTFQLSICPTDFC